MERKKLKAWVSRLWGGLFANGPQNLAVLHVEDHIGMPGHLWIVGNEDDGLV